MFDYEKHEKIFMGCCFLSIGFATIGLIGYIIVLIMKLKGIECS